MKKRALIFAIQAFSTSVSSFFHFPRGLNFKDSLHLDSLLEMWNPTCKLNVILQEKIQNGTFYLNKLIMICVFVGHILYMLFSLLVNYFFSDSNFCKGKLIFACLNFEDFYSRVFNFPAKLSTSWRYDIWWSHSSAALRNYKIIQNKIKIVY